MSGQFADRSPQKRVGHKVLDVITIYDDDNDCSDPIPNKMGRMDTSEEIYILSSGSEDEKSPTIQSPVKNSAEEKPKEEAQPPTPPPLTSSPSTARPLTPQSSIAQPSTAQPSTPPQSTAQPSTAQPLIAQPSTSRPNIDFETLFQSVCYLNDNCLKI